MRTFDALGRVTQETRPDNSTTQTVDPSMGTISRVFNVLDQLSSQTDAKSQTTTFAVDGQKYLTHLPDNILDPRG